MERASSHSATSPLRTVGPLFLGNHSGIHCEAIDIYGDDVLEEDSDGWITDDWLVDHWQVAPQRDRRFSVWLVGHLSFPPRLLTATHSTTRAQFFLDIARALPELHMPVPKSLWHALWKRTDKPARMRPAATVRAALDAFLRDNGVAVGLMIVVDHATGTIRDQYLAQARCVQCKHCFRMRHSTPDAAT